MHIYRAEILSIPRLAAISAHPSVLPNYRGLEVFFWAMANGEDQIGVSVFKLTPRIDFGLVANEVVLPLSKPDSMRRVYRIITEAAASLLIKTKLARSRTAPQNSASRRGPAAISGCPRAMPCAASGAQATACSE